MLYVEGGTFPDVYAYKVNMSCNHCAQPACLPTCPTGAIFNPTTRAFSWTPAFGDSGNYNVTFTVTDDGSPAESNSEVVTISVGNVNRPPVLGTIGSKSVDEGTPLTFTVTASDPDGDNLTFSASNVPTGASFNPSTRVFSWTPAFGDAGNYDVTFTVTDDGTPAESDSEVVTIMAGAMK